MYYNYLVVSVIAVWECRDDHLLSGVISNRFCPKCVSEARLSFIVSFIYIINILINSPSVNLGTELGNVDEYYSDAPAMLFRCVFFYQLCTVQ